MKFKPAALLLASACVAGLLASDASAAPRDRRLAAAVKNPTPPAAGEGSLLPTPAPTPRPAAAQAPVQEEGYPPMLTDQMERDLNARFRQELVRIYLPLLARPTAWKAVHDDPVPEHSQNWDHLRQPVKDRLVGRLDAVDARSRGHGAMEAREIDRAFGERPDKRPEHLRNLLLKTPRIDDVAVQVHRVQPLGEDVYRLDVDVTLSCQGNQTVNTFRALDIERKDGNNQYPARLIQDAKCGAMPLNLDPGSSFFSIDQWTQWVSNLIK
ncbi:MAG: hypothetical protein ABIJ09_09490 [Pseudomonadota bacterium]